MAQDQIDITRIVNTSILQSLPDAFYNATGMVTGIQNLEGELITTIPQDDFTPFCRNMFFSKLGHSRCLESNRYGARMAFKQNNPYIYVCHAGLIDVAAPIIFNGTHVASVSCGQVLLEKPDSDIISSLANRIADFPEHFQEKQMQALRKVKILPEKHVHAIATLLKIIANEVVNLIIDNMIAKEKNDRHLQLIDELKAHSILEKEIKNAQIRLKESELKTLEAQINPHFLYNTLDSIQWMAVMQGSEDIYNMIFALSEIMRYSLSRGKSLVRIRDEVRQAENYLYIQKMRYGDKIEFDIEVNDGIMDFHIPKLILQPLIENAIQHGIEPKKDRGRITIKGFKNERGDAVLEVKDNGIGIAAEKRREIEDTLEINKIDYDHIDLSNSHGLGLINVHNRLLHYSGNEYGLILRNGTNDKLTTLQITIPRRLRYEV